MSGSGQLQLHVLWQRHAQGGKALSWAGVADVEDEPFSRNVPGHEARVHAVMDDPDPVAPDAQVLDDFPADGVGGDDHARRGARPAQLPGEIPRPRRLLGVRMEQGGEVVHGHHHRARERRRDVVRLVVHAGPHAQEGRGAGGIGERVCEREPLDEATDSPGWRTG